MTDNTLTRAQIKALRVLNGQPDFSGHIDRYGRIVVKGERLPTAGDIWVRLAAYGYVAFDTTHHRLFMTIAGSNAYHQAPGSRDTHSEDV